MSAIREVLLVFAIALCVALTGAWDGWWLTASFGS